MIARIRSAIRRVRGSELGGFAGDTFFVGTWQGAISVADLIQIALITHALGLHAYGRLAIVLSFVVLIGQFFDVRVGVAATTFGSRKLVAGDLRGAAGVFQLSYLVDGVTGVAGFVVVAGLAPFVGPHLVGNGGTWLIFLYALTLLASTVDESSISILRLLDRFRLIAVYTIALEVLRVTALVVALSLWKSLTAVLLVLLAYDVVAGAVNLAAAAVAYRRVAHRPLRQPSLEAVGAIERRSFIRTVLQTNVVSYARLSQQQLPTLLIGVLSGANQVGLYKVGTAAAAMIGRAADPAYAALLPRLSRMWSAGKRADVRRLLARATLIAAPAITIVLVVLVVLRHPVLELIGGSAARDASVTVLVLAAIGQAVNAALFWNVGLLFAAGRAGIVAVVAVVATLIQIALLIPLTVFFDANGAAGALLASYVVTNIAVTAAALRVLGWPGGRQSQAGQLADSPIPAPHRQP